MIKSVLKPTFLLFLFLAFSSCTFSNNENSNENILNNYIQGLNSTDFKLISSLIDDSITTAEMDFVLTKNSQELYQQFQWDSVFSPQYEILEFTTTGSEKIATISKTCRRIEFLHDSAIIYKAKIDFNNNKISKLHTIDYVYFDNTKWQFRRDSLVEWIDRFHPELSGFIYDLSKKGSLNYLKAIEFYRCEK